MSVALSLGGSVSGQSEAPYSRTVDSLLRQANDAIDTDKWDVARDALRKAKVLAPDARDIDVLIKLSEENCDRESKRYLKEAQRSYYSSDFGLARWNCRQVIRYAGAVDSVEHQKCVRLMSDMTLFEAHQALEQDDLRHARKVLEREIFATPDVRELLGDVGRQCRDVASEYYRSARIDDETSDRWGVCNNCRLGLSFSGTLARDQDAQWCRNRVKRCQRASTSEGLFAD